MVVLVGLYLTALSVSLALIGFMSSFLLLFLALAWNEVFIVVLLISLCVAVWRLNAFLKLAHNSERYGTQSGARRRAFAIGVCASLALPVWWSSVAILPGADKVALLSEKEISYDPATEDISVTVQMKNMAGYALAARDEGSFIQWWDDEHPDQNRFFFS
jgi:hypothetical protein